MFTEGVGVFEEAYKNNLFERLYTTDLTFIPDEFKKSDWLKVVDSSKRISEIIDTLHDGRGSEVFSMDAV